MFAFTSSAPSQAVRQSSTASSGSRQRAIRRLASKSTPVPRASARSRSAIVTARSSSPTIVLEPSTTTPDSAAASSTWGAKARATGPRPSP